MTDADAFLERIIAHPDEDWPRLVYADWLDESGDPRGLFIRVQCALAHLAPDDPRRFELAQREETLLDAHYPAWTEPFRGLASGLEFRRGFVEVVNIEARVFLLRAADLVRLTAIRHVRLLDVGSSLNAIATSPHLSGLSGLTLFAQHLGDTVAQTLAESPFLSRLTTLELGRNRITDVGVKAIAESECFGQLASLDLGDNHVTDLGAQTLAACVTMETLRRLDLRRNEIGPDGLDALSATERLVALTHLNLGHNRVGVTRAYVPARSGPVVTRLRTLDVRANAINATTINTLTSSPHLTGLHSLDIGHNELANAGTIALAESQSVETLRLLYLNDNHIADDGARALAHSPHLNYLTTLELGHNPMINDTGARWLLDPRNLRSLRRLGPPGLGLSHHMRRALLARYGMPLRRTNG